MEKTFKIAGLDCANCAAKMESALRKIPGVQHAAINFMTQKLILTGEDAQWDRILADANNAIAKVLPGSQIVSK